MKQVKKVYKKTINEKNEEAMSEGKMGKMLMKRLGMKKGKKC